MHPVLSLRRLVRSFSVKGIEPDMVLVRYSAWLEEKDVSKLTVATIQSFLNTSSNKPTDLVEAYRVALDPRQWREDRREMLEKLREEAVEDRRGLYAFPPRALSGKA
jgi:hypothetical protein